MPRESARKHRIAGEIQKLLNELLLAEVKDPRLSGARVSDVEVTARAWGARCNCAAFQTCGFATTRARAAPSRSASSSTMRAAPATTPTDGAR